MRYIIYVFTTFIFLLNGCTPNKQNEMSNTFRQDVDFLNQYVKTIILTDGSNGRIAVVPEYQGRVMTSSLEGDGGMSFGWLNRELISSGKQLENFNPYGGEDRFWLGPEGGQFSLFHMPGGPFDLGNWYVPDQVDIMPYEVVDQSESHLAFHADFKVINYTGTEFEIAVDRKIKMIRKQEAEELLGIANSGDLDIVGYESENRIKNAGDSSWKKETGLVSIWILGMFSPGDNVTIIIPFYQGGTGSLGPVVNDTYFGKVPPERLHITEGVILFKGDGKYRSKIGLNWKRAKNVMGSYDEDRSVLTVVLYNKPEEEQPYIKSMWEIMDNPYNGDVINSFNDGPATPGAKPLGPFYELESSSPVKELQPGEDLTHVHKTFHIQGNESDLNSVCEKIFGIKLQLVRDVM
jgi:hypothetical protein